MRSGTRLLTITWIVLSVCLAVAADDETAPPLRTDSAAAREYFTDLPLQTHRGEEVRFYSDVLAGKVVLISGFYTNCTTISPRQKVVLISGFYTNCTTISPRQNLILSRLQAALGDRLGREVVIVSITIDPKRDDVDTVAKYAEVFHPTSGWVFLTGKPENVDWVNYKLGQYLEYLEDHKGTYLLGNMSSGLWKKAPGHAQTDDLYREIQRLLEDDG